ncbi:MULTISPECIES: hypothetical protein [Flavobacterium]|nr:MULTISPECIES: hypothetical protein [Flavobacterium]
MIRHIKLQQSKFLVYFFIFLSSFKTDAKVDIKIEKKSNSITSIVDSSTITESKNIPNSENGKTKFELVEVKQISKNKSQDSIISRLKSIKVEIDGNKIFINNVSAKYVSDKSESKQFFGRNYVYNYYTDYLYKNYNIDIKKEVNYIELSYEDAQKYPFKDFFLEGGVTVFANDYLLLQYSDYIITFKKALKKSSEKKSLVVLPFDYQEYLDECYLEDNAKCNEKYPKIIGNELKSVTSLINKKINKNKPDVIYHLDNGGLPFETYVFQIRDENTDYLLNSMIISVGKGQLISEQLIGVQADGDIPENVNYINKSFILSKDLLITIFEMRFSKKYKKLNESYKINSDGKIMKIKK